MARNQSTWQALDKWTLLMVIIIAIFGWMNIYGASYNPDSANSSMFDISNFAGKQFIWIITSILLATITLIIDRRAYEYLAYFLYALTIILLLVTSIIAPEVKGSKSFIEFGSFRFQPAEFSKFVIALTLAKYMGRDEYKLKSWKDMIVPVLLVLVPMFIIMVPQNETGSALILTSFIFMFYREGMSGYVLLTIFIAVVCAVISIKYSMIPLSFGIGNYGIFSCMLIILLVEILFLIIRENQMADALWLIGGIVVFFGICLLVNIWHKVNFNRMSMLAVGLSTIYLLIIAYKQKLNEIGILVIFSLFMVGYCYSCNFAFDKLLQPHQKNRIEELLGIIDDPSGIGYNTYQSKIAIATGRITGKGFTKGTQTQMKYVPEQHTDFIFSTVGEEWGFIGGAGLIILYTLLILRLIKMCERQRNKFSRIYGYGVVGILFLHVAINIGMAVGLLPVIGIPLPFFSYGGSSLWGFTILLFIFLKLDTDRVNEL